MRKTLGWASATLFDPNIKKMTLDIEAAKGMLDIIYRKRREYMERMHRDPAGITLPVRLYIVLEMHRDHFMTAMQVDHERRSTLFGLEVMPCCGGTFRFIPRQQDVMMLAHMEEIENET